MRHFEEISASVRALENVSTARLCSVEGVDGILVSSRISSLLNIARETPSMVLDDVKMNEFSNNFSLAISVLDFAYIRLAPAHLEDIFRLSFVMVEASGPKMGAKF